MARLHAPAFTQRTAAIRFPWHLRPLSSPQSPRSATTKPRAFSTTHIRGGVSPLFALGALSNSREGRYIRKAAGNRISPVEYSPQLQLIRSSEVDPFMPKTKAAIAKTGKPLAPPRAPPRKRGSSANANRVALSVGYAVLDRQKRAAKRSAQLLRSIKRKHLRQVTEWQQYARKLTRENRWAAACILASVGLAAGAVVWGRIPENTPKKVDVGSRAKQQFQGHYMYPRDTRNPPKRTDLEVMAPLIPVQPVTKVVAASTAPTTVRDVASIANPSMKQPTKGDKTVPTAKISNSSARREPGSKPKQTSSGWFWR